MKYAIEFRNGSYLQSLEADHGGPKHTAMLFDTAKAAEAFIRKHEWILFNGGMVVSVPS